MKKFWKWKNQKVLNQETNQESVERVLFLNGTIAEDSWFDDDVTPQMFKEELMDRNGNITLEMREKRNKAWEAAKAFVETKRDKDGLLSAEDVATYAEMEQKVQNYSAEIARMEEMEAMEAELNKPVNTPITNRPMGGANPQEKKTGRASNEYKEAID